MSGMLLDAVLLATTALLLIGYEVAARRRRRQLPDRDNRGLHDRVRSLWVATVMDDPKKDVLAVQTLRNSVMAASFMASTAAIVVTGSLTFGEVANRLAGSWHRALGLPAADSLFLLKILLLMGVFSAGFVYFALSIRLYNHVGYMINVQRSRAPDITPELVARYLNRAGALYGNGMRAFFAGLPLLAWLFDGVLMLLLAVLLVTLRRSLDFQPRAAGR